MKKVFILIMFIFTVIGSIAMRNNNQSVNNEGITETISKITDKEIEKVVNMENDDLYELTEGRRKIMDDFRERTSYRFVSQTVRENLIEREVELREEEFEKLRKGQYLNQKMADEKRSRYVGIVEMLGMYDGDMVSVMPNENFREPPLGNIYYIIGENTYAVLFFRDRHSETSPLESVEIWKEIWHEDGTYELEMRELKIR